MWTNVKILASSNENVKKYVFEKDDAVAESVLYKYPTYKERTVICCSTQSGCPVGCRFCGAGDYFVRSLTTEEIISQPVRLLQDVTIETNTEASHMYRLQIMFMSMGEPLLNLKHLVPALHKLYSLYPQAALLVSTAAPKVDYTPLLEAASQIPTVGLQFSVHESTDEARDQLIPFKAKLNLKEIREEGDKFFTTTGRTPFFNYCVHDKNGTDADADRLAILFDSKHWQATISVICEREEHVAAANERQKSIAESFCEKMKSRGFMTRVFDPAGQDDVGGGCGQLHFVQKWMKEHQESVRKSIGYGLPVLHTPGGPLSLPVI